MSLPSPEMMAALAATRFGLGARPGEIAAAKPDARGVLKSQINEAGGDQPKARLGQTAARLRGFRVAYRQRVDARTAERLAPGPKPRQGTDESVSRYYASFTADELRARTQLAATTAEGFRERWTLFWTNHFFVSQTVLDTIAIVGSMEREAIRPHVFGPFADLLVAAVGHPATLTYLLTARSFGPNSFTGGLPDVTPPGAVRPGLDQTLARQILDAYALGPGAARSDEDVRELALALTGWSVGRLEDPNLQRPADPDELQGRPFFRPEAHERGARTVLGKTYPDTGAEQATAILRDLAAQPATARFLARKLAVHFVGEGAPASLVGTLEAAYVDSGGRLDAVAFALIEADDAWTPGPAPLKSHQELAISAFRAFDFQPYWPDDLWEGFHAMGQRSYVAPTPLGWPDTDWFWGSPDALMKRLTWCEGFADIAANLLRPTAEVAEMSLGERLSPATRAAIAAVDGTAEAITVLLMSPEFQRR